MSSEVVLSNPEILSALQKPLECKQGHMVLLEVHRKLPSCPYAKMFQNDEVSFGTFQVKCKACCHLCLFR